MRKLITTTFVSMDGVMQAPGGPKEDTSGGFSYGGWTYEYWDEASGNVMTDFMNRPFELLLGKRTYDIFAAYWPTAKEEVVIGQKFNATRKYVASHTEQELSWHNSVCLSGDVAAKIAELKKENGPDLWVHGSGNLIQTLLKNNLIDTMHIWTIPVTLGSGKRLFAEGTQPVAWSLTDSKITAKGVIIGTYVPAGEIKTGTVGE